MKVERYKVKFENGLVEGVEGKKRFNLLYDHLQNNPQVLVKALKNRGVNNEDLELFFSVPKKDTKTGTISWEIDQTADFATYGIISLDNDELPEKIKNDIESRSADLLQNLKSVSTDKERSDQKNTQVNEVLKSIFDNEANIKIFAGYNPTAKSYFPVAVGWGGTYTDTAQKDPKLVTTTPIGNGEPGPDDAKNIIPNQTKSFGKLPIYWIIWLLVFFIVLIIAYLLLPSCGVKNFINTCQEEETNLTSLENKRDNLLESLIIENNICLSENFKSTPAKNNPPINEQETEADLAEEVETRLNEKGGKTSKLMVSLIWNTREDLDLKVTCPGQKYVNHANRDVEKNNCGTLDIDANVASKSNKITKRPIENILLKETEGYFEIQVKSIKNKESLNSGTPFKVHVKSDQNNTIFEDKIFPSKIKTFTFER